MTARPCRTGCGYDAEGRSDLCAAHRKRAQLNNGDPLAHIPVQRKPSRKPAAVAERSARRAALLNVTIGPAVEMVASRPVTSRRGGLGLA